MKKIVYIIFFLLIIFVRNSYSQIFNEVGCRVQLDRITFALGTYKNSLLHSGFCAYPICNNVVNCVGVWNDSTWSTLGNGTIPLVHGIPKAYLQVGNDLYMGGDFYYVDSLRANGIAKWNGNNWNLLKLGLDEGLFSDRILSLAWYNGNLYAGGYFNRMDGVTGYNCIARWNGQTWNKVSGGILRNGVGREITCMQVFKNELYVAGYFDQAGSQTTYNIARWDGNIWKPLGNGGVWDKIEDMVVDSHRNVLYVGGHFNGVDSNIISKKIAMWDGVQWHSLPEPPLGSSISALEMYNGYLYAGSMGNNHLARWDGENWEAIKGVNGTINDLKVYNDKLYIGGSFNTILNDTIPALVSYYDTASVFVGISLSQNYSSEKIKIFPNPTKDIIQIESKIPIKHYKITDINGRVVQEGEMTNKSIIINQLNKAIYLIHFFDEDQRNIGTEKFVLE